MKIPFPFLSACLVFALACGGCVRSEQPLSSVAEAKADPRLVGQWRSAEEDKENKDEFMRVTFSEKGVGHLTVQKKGGAWEEDPNLPEFFITRTAKASYLNVLMFDADQKDSNASKDKHFLFFKYSLSNDGRTLSYQGIKTELFLEAVRAKTLKGQNQRSKNSKEDDEVLLQDSSAAILRFVEALPDEAYTPPVQLIKVP